MDHAKAISSMPVAIFTYRGKSYGYKIKNGEPTPYLIDEEPELTPEMEEAIDRMLSKEQNVVENTE